MISMESPFSLIHAFHNSSTAYPQVAASGDPIELYTLSMYKYAEDQLYGPTTLST
jgi:hypothetical protein